VPAIGATNPADPSYQRLLASRFADWRLMVEGSVTRPRAFSLIDASRLYRLPRPTYSVAKPDPPAVMRIFQLARRPPQWLRVMLAALLLAFVLDTVAHLTHTHEASPATASHNAVCSLCVSFANLADAPRYLHEVGSVQPITIAFAFIVIVAVARRPWTSARSRAPPVVS
jgi:hypothetical protein